MQNSTFIYFCCLSLIYTYLLGFQEEHHNFQMPYLRNWKLQPDSTPLDLPLLVARETVWRHRPPVATVGKCSAGPGFTLSSHCLSLSLHSQCFFNNSSKVGSEPCLAEPPMELASLSATDGWAWGCPLKAPLN